MTDATTAPDPDDDFDAAMTVLAQVCGRAAAGDFETRVPPLPGGGRAAAARNAINDLLDLTDCYVRESAAALSAAAEGRFHRRFLTAGLDGAFRRGASTINAASDVMRAGAERLAEAQNERRGLADEMEATVLRIAEQVATAATDMGTTAGGLASFARNAVGEAEQALDTVGSLKLASNQICNAVGMISRMALQTQLLALNATIEAARAGRAGRGFSVVAKEVKSLAEEAARASETIVDEVANVREATANTIGVLEVVAGRIRDMDGLVQSIAVAVDGRTTDRPPTVGLSGLADVLRTEATRFVDVIRVG